MFSNAPAASRSSRASSDRKARDRRRLSRENAYFRRLRHELLEDRRLLTLGSISGTVFDDLNGNGIFDTGEEGMGGREVYLDQNQNGGWDEEEITAVTATDGSYQFDELDPGQYWVGQIVEDDDLQTLPGPAAGPALLGDVLGEIPLSLDPMGFTFHNGGIYVNARSQNLVYQVDTASGDVSPQFAAPEGSDLWGLASDGSYLWATDTANDMLWQLDMTGQVVHSLAAPGTFPAGITWDGSALWVLDVDSQTIDQVDPVTGQVVTSLEVPAAAGSLSGLAYDGQYLWMNRWLDPWATSPATRDANRTYAMEPGSGEVVREFVTPYARDHQSLGLAYDGENLWVSQSFDQRLLRVDTNVPAVHQVTCDGNQVTGVDFGYFQLASVSGSVYTDFDKNGFPDPGETGLEGWRVFADENENGIFDYWESDTLTDSLGSYQLEGLRPGDYSIVVQLPQPGWFATGPQDGVQAVAVTASGESLSSIDFGSTLLSVGTLGPTTRVNTTTDGAQQPVTPGTGQQTHAIAMDGQGNYVVVWHGNGPGDADGVFMQRFGSDGELLGPETRVNTTTAGVQKDPMAAMAADTGQYVVVWNSEGAIVGQRFGQDGSPSGGEFIIEEVDSKQHSGGYSVAMDTDGDFAVLYRLYKQKGLNYSRPFMVAMYDQDGVPQGNSITVVDPRLINGDGALAMDADGNFIVVWADTSDVDEGLFLFAQRYDNSGSKLGSQLRLSETGDQFDHYANVAMDAFGNFAVTWQYGYGGDYVARTFTVDGTPASDQVVLGTHNATERPAIAMQPDGDFVVAWEYNPTNLSSDIYARRFHADGTPMGDEIYVSQTLIGEELVPSVAVDDRGNFTVVWSGQGEVDYPDVFAQRYGALMAVANITPAEGSIVTTPPIDFVVDFYHPYLASSVDAGDLWVNGTPADAVELTSPTTLTFSFTTSPVQDDGVQYVHMEAGSIVRESDSLVLTAHDSTFRYDSLLMEVEDTVPSPGGELVLQELSSVTTAVASMAGMNGGNGGWPVLYGSAPVSTGALQVAVDEDMLLDAERSHTYEQLAYLAFGADSSGEAAPYLRTGIVAGVGTADWTTVTLDHTYSSMVVVATANYSNLDPPLVTRIQDATGDSFQIRVDRVDGLTEDVADIEVHYLVVEEGQYTAAADGVTMEAHRVDSTITDWAGSWVGQPQSYANTYVNPVVVGQVLTANDPDFSVFWARGDDSYSPPSSTSLFVGKHVGEDPDVLREAEEIGYIVLEAGMGTIGTVAEGMVDYLAGVGANTVLGMDSGATTYPLNLSSLEVTYNEPYDPLSVGADDLTLSSGVVLQAEILPGDTVIYRLAGVADGLTVDMAAGAVLDLYGNPMLPFTATYTLPSLPHPPVAEAGGPYTVVAGGTITLDASGSTDPDLPSGDTLTYAWDFDEDGQFDDATGVAPVFDAAGYMAGVTIDVSLLVTDSTGLTSADVATISVVSATTQLIYDSSDGPITIGDLKTVTSSIQVPDVATIATLTVRINLTHANPSDLIGVLIAPDGVTEFNLDSGGSTPILSGSYEYAVPDAVGLPLPGTWTLQIQDTVKNRQRGTLYDWSLIVEPEAQPLLSRGNAAGSGGSQAVLAWSDARRVAQAAMALWGQQANVAHLADLNVKVADLPAGQLGLAWGHTIMLDSNGDGAGWYLDGAVPAAGHYDLLTVVSHEIGHLLGYDHSDKAGDLMAATLTAGTRRLSEISPGRLAPWLLREPPVNRTQRQLFDHPNMIRDSVEELSSDSGRWALPSIATQSVDPSPSRWEASDARFLNDIADEELEVLDEELLDVIVGRTVEKG